VPAYSYLVKRRLLIGSGYREPNELAPEATTWPNLQTYLDLGWVEAIPDMTDSEREHAVHRASPRPQTYAPSGPEPTPTPRREGERFPAGEGAPDQQEIRCRNCRSLNWLCADLADKVVFLCWRCSQPQSIAEARQHSAPVGVEEWSHSINALRPIDPSQPVPRPRKRDAGGKQ
jgi:hypothetical protein